MNDSMRLVPRLEIPERYHTVEVMFGYGLRDYRRGNKKPQNRFCTHCTVRILSAGGDAVRELYGETRLDPRDRRPGEEKILGRKIALARAISELPREERAAIWEAVKASGMRLFADPHRRLRKQIAKQILNVLAVKAIEELQLTARGKANAQKQQKQIINEARAHVG